MSALEDKLLGPLRRIIRMATARVDFYALYSAVVNTDNGDETLDVTPEDTRLPSMSHIPKAYGAPGAKSTVAQGARVLLAFANGDPSKPTVVLYDATSAPKVSLQATTVNLAGESGSSVGRVGDAVAANTSMAAWMSAVGAAVGAVVPPFLTTFPTGAPTDFGKISAGSSKVKAE